MPKNEAPAGLKKSAVLGWPVNHSLSPRLHGYWLKQHTINATYEAIAVESTQLKETIKGLAARGYCGFNLTIPHKEQAIEYVDVVDDYARRIGAINTILIRNGKLIGSNTDVYGFVENVKASKPQIPIPHALVIGAGGAARAICAGLHSEGVSVTLMNRTRGKAEKIAVDLGGKINVIEWKDYPKAMALSKLVVNATSLGMKGQPPLELSLDTLPADAIVTDIVYNPLTTPLLAAAKARGNKVVDGLGMLLYQAQPAFEAFFGVKPEVTAELRAYVLAGLS